MKIVIATSNHGKIKEIKSVFNDLPVTVFSQQEFSVHEAPETGSTFIENAILKARWACQHTRLPALADDSGLEVDALLGAPGIYSARYAGEPSNSQRNIDKLLSALIDIPDDKRTARFQCAMVFMRHEKDASPLIFEGTWEGKILKSAQGNLGFGYDPVFYVPTHDCSAAQLPIEIKNAISHRGQALHKFKIVLASVC